MPAVALKGAACAAPAVDPDIFFAADDFSHPDLDAREMQEVNTNREYRAKLTCSGCPVRLPCLQMSIATPVAEYGIFGGLGPVQRMRLAGHRLSAARHAKEAPSHSPHAGPEHSRADEVLRTFLAGASIEETAARTGLRRRTVVREIRRVALVEDAS